MARCEGYFGHFPASRPEPTIRFGSIPGVEATLAVGTAFMQSLGRVYRENFRMKKSLLVAVSFFLLGCGTSYEQTVVKPSMGSLEAGKSVLISAPQDGSYGGKEYEGSGQVTAGVARGAFLRFATQADVTTDCHGADCFDRARAGGYGYYVRPEILQWEDRATEWSGVSDKVEIRLSIIDVRTGQEIASQVIAGKSSVWTFGGDHPQDLLKEPVTEYVEGLYR